MTDSAQLPPEEEKAAEVESYGGVPMTEEELGQVWTTTAGDTAPATTGGQEPPD